VLDFAKEMGLVVCGLDFSPIRGPEGNIEYLACFRDSKENMAPDILRVVDAAHEGAD
jgi:23S rRNA (cytidine1920-2'-O)/16S rRNA (cytidine1409-2'-O)-methyltransferase